MEHSQSLTEKSLETVEAHAREITAPELRDAIFAVTREVRQLHFDDLANLASQSDQVDFKSLTFSPLPAEGREPSEALEQLKVVRVQIDQLRKDGKATVLRFLNELGRVRATGTQAKSMVEEINSLLDSMGLELELKGISGRLVFHSRESFPGNSYFEISSRGRADRKFIKLHDFSQVEVTLSDSRSFPQVRTEANET